MSEGFNLGDMLRDVSKLDTNREQIEYIRRELIHPDPNNFYALSGLDQLADNIATCGLQQPIRVRPHPDQADAYMIVSGHRRNAAIDLLAKEDPDSWKELPCIVEREKISPNLQQLRLIYANANTRVLTSAELADQAAQVEELLYKLKEEGYEFPGRMRDHVAQAVNASTSKLARLKVIRTNLIGDWAKLYKQNKINESTAYALAKMPADWQAVIAEERYKEANYLYAKAVEDCMKYFNSISKIKCTHGAKSCDNAGPKMHKCAKFSYYGYNQCENTCCFDCNELRTCKSSCLLAAARKKELKDVERQSKQDAANQQKERDQPVIDFIQGVYSRIGLMREANNVSVDALYHAQKRMYGISDEEKQVSMEKGKAKIDVNATLPFGYSFRASDAEHLCAVADLLHCSIDYLLGRDPSPQPGWKTGDPQTIGEYAVMARYSPEGAAVLTDMTWNGLEWLECDNSIEGLGIQILRWTSLPEEEL